VATIKNPEVLRAALSEAIRFGLYRAKSTQVLPHIFGTALSMILPLQIYHFLYKEGRSRIMAVIGIILTLGGIAVTYTRGVYLACGLGISLSFLCLKSISKKMMFIALIGCLLFVVLYNPRVISFCSEYLLKLLNPSTIAFDREHSMESRISDYAFTADRLKNRLFLGQGYGTYESGVGFDKYVDNSYLYNLIETGVIGFLAFLFLIYGIIFKTGRLLTKYQYYDSDIYMCRFMHIGLIVFFFQCLTYDAFGFAGASKLFWVLFGLLLALYNIAKKDMGREHAAVS
jgi:O-antigen ligase